MAAGSSARPPASCKPPRNGRLAGLLVMLAPTVTPSPSLPVFHLPANVVFIKVPKCGSSTMSGILRRICLHHNMTGCLPFSRRKEDRGEGEPRGASADEQGPPWSRGLHAKHEPVTRASGLFEREYPNAFVLTMLREPAERSLSDYYHKRVSRGKRRSIASQKLARLRKFVDFQYNYVGGPVFGSAGATLDQYHFVGLAHRFNESLVVLQLLLGLSAHDILYVPSKVADGQMRDFQGFVLSRHPPLDEEEPEVVEFARQTYPQLASADYALFREAERRLDAHIARLQPAFASAYAHFVRLLEQAQRVCSPVVAKIMAREAALDSAVAGTRTKELGRWEGCLYHDNGCGYQCLDTLSTSRALHLLR